MHSVAFGQSGEFRHVRVEGLIATLVTDAYVPSVAIAETSRFDDAVTSGLDGCAGRRAIIDTGVQVQLPGKWMIALTKA